MRRGRRHYAARYTRNGAYSLTGRPLLVRTFDSEAERDAYVKAQQPPSSVLFDGQRIPLPAHAVVTERSSGRTIPLAEVIPGL